MIRLDTIVVILDNHQQLNPLDLNDLEAKQAKKKKEKAQRQQKRKIILA